MINPHNNDLEYYLENYNDYDLKGGTKMVPGTHWIRPAPIPKPIPKAIPKQAPITISHGIQNIDIYPHYNLEFDIVPMELSKSWNKLINFYTTNNGGEWGKAGGRIPGIWFIPDTLKLHIRTGGDTFDSSGNKSYNDGYDPNINLEKGKKYKVVVNFVNTKLVIKIFSYNEGKFIFDNSNNPKRTNHVFDKIMKGKLRITNNEIVKIGNIKYSNAAGLIQLNQIPPIEIHKMRTMEVANAFRRQGGVVLQKILEDRGEDVIVTRENIDTIRKELATEFINLNIDKGMSDESYAITLSDLKNIFKGKWCDTISGVRQSQIKKNQSYIVSLQNKLAQRQAHGNALQSKLKTDLSRCK